jgi:mono/diheme cytochrome c family protein
MKRALYFFLIAAAACAQDGAVRRGEQLYRSNCATPYCHGPDGTAGRAPRLVGHRYNLNGMFKVITWGIPGTGMPEFTTRLKTEEIADLVAYVMTMGGGSAPAPAPATPPRVLTPEARQGRALFFDAARTGACGSCHELEGWGVPVGPDLAARRVTNLRSIATPHVMTARAGGGEPPFPALLVERTNSKVRVYDLTAPIPVLRAFPTSQVVLDTARPWRHEQVLRLYSDGELDAIAAYLSSL